jgi:hypothetical protein
VIEPGNIVVPLNCHSCGGAIEVACEVSANPEDRQTVRFACPYCGVPRDFPSPGRVVYVAMRQAGEGETIKH